MVVTSTISPVLKFGLRLFGVWPDVPFILARRLIHILTTSLVQYFQYRYIFTICKHGEFHKLIDSLPATVYYSLTSFKVMTVWKHHRIVRELLATVDTDWRECLKIDQYLHIMTMKAITSRFYTNFLMIFNVGAALLYFGGDNMTAIVDMLQGYNVTSRPFPLRVLLPFDAEQSPLYELIVLALYLHTATMSCMVNIISSFVITLVYHACGQIEIICEQLKTLSEEIHYYGSLDYKTKMVVGRHNKVISFSRKIDRLFSYIALLQVFGNTIIICFLGLVIMISHSTTTIDKLKIFFAYSGITLEIFIFCYVGEHLCFMSKTVGDAGYDSLWYNMSPIYSKNILFIIMRSQKQLTITAGGMADLSLEAFTSIMKAAASYMSVLNAMY